eukprot:8366397-Karenia_brevis.AAC.1
MMTTVKHVRNAADDDHDDDHDADDDDDDDDDADDNDLNDDDNSGSRHADSSGQMCTVSSGGPQ